MSCAYGASVKPGVDPNTQILVDRNLWEVVTSTPSSWLDPILDLFGMYYIKASDLCALNVVDPPLPSVVSIGGALLKDPLSVGTVYEWVRQKLEYAAFTNVCLCNGSGAVTTYDTHVVADTPWTYHKLDELAGPTLIDTMGNQNLTVNSITSYNQSGPVTGVPAIHGNPAAYWTNSGAGPNTVWAPTAGNAVEAWIYASSLPGANTAMIYGYEEDHANGSWLALDSTGHIEYWWANAPAFNHWTDTSSLFTTGAWHHVVGTLDGCVAKIYIDGTLASFSGTTQCAPTAFQNAANEWLGGYVGATVWPVLSGYLARCAWYPHNLTGARVLDHYNTMQGIVSTTPVAPVVDSQPATLEIRPDWTCTTTGDLCTRLQQMDDRLRTLTELLFIVQRQTVPFATAHGTVHSGLSGQGTFTTPGGLCGLSIDITTTPAYLSSDLATPPSTFKFGTIAWGTSDGYGPRRWITHDPHLFLNVEPSATSFGYTFEPGVVATITELQRVP